jgi:hypothetical protein
MESVLRERVGQLRRRVRLLVTARWVFAALVAAALLCSVLVVLDRLEWVSAPPEYLAGLFALAALAGAVIGLTRPVSLMDVAQLADQRLGLKERLSSGIDFMQRGAEDPMTAAQLADAAGHSEGLRPREVFPFRLPREAKFFAGSLVLLLALIFVPELRVFQSPQVRAEKLAMKKEGVRIEKLAKDYKKRGPQKSSEITKRISANMQALGKEMRRGRISKKQAMLRMSRLSKEMRDAQRQLAVANTPRSLDQAAQDLKKAAEASMRRGANPAGAKMMADMARALENKDYEAAAPHAPAARAEAAEWRDEAGRGEGRRRDAREDGGSDEGHAARHRREADAGGRQTPGRSIEDDGAPDAAGDAPGDEPGR